MTFSSDNLSRREQTEPMPMQYSDLKVQEGGEDTILV